MAKPLRVGFDFDGVIAYNPLRVFRAPITYTKRQFLGMKKTKFSYPKSSLQKKLWAILHEFSFFPGVGFDELRKTLDEYEIEAYLVTGRFGYLEDALYKWLNQHKAKDFFKKIIVNRKDEQPHLYKEKQIKNLGLDIFIEDNWDIVEHLKIATPKTKVFWIYNILDSKIDYEHKYPNLRSAVRAIPKKNLKK